MAVAIVDTIEKIMLTIVFTIEIRHFDIPGSSDNNSAVPPSTVRMLSITGFTRTINS